MDFDALVEAQTGLGTAAVIVMNKQVHVHVFCWRCNSLKIRVCTVKRVGAWWIIGKGVKKLRPRRGIVRPDTSKNQ